MPIGLYSKLYSGIGAHWVNNRLGGVFYEVFWCFGALCLLPAARPRAIAGWVFAITCALETLQLWHPPTLERLRETAIGATILGASFDPWDFPYYVVGAAMGWSLMAWVQGGADRG